MPSSGAMHLCRSANARRAVNCSRAGKYVKMACVLVLSSMAPFAYQAAFAGFGKPSSRRQRSAVPLTPCEASPGSSAGTEFQEAVAEGLPVLVDFTSSFCGPCKLMHKVIDKMEKQFEGRVKVLTLELDRVPDLASEFGVRKLPTALLFGAGSRTPVQTFSGLQAGAQIQQAIEQQLQIR
eukprot:TRINITY_DN11592_c0_g1_i1.p1 TRINITY_DN11592_c0_g1~~TRINITY_DN11592_c0_g1_i1.p1  ORF type:complete len:180 (+),score=33.55 TRINITY_DN11592_c0_g1_i1:17-556(+)